MDTFSALKLEESISISLKRLKFDLPTPIQSQTIPLALKGRDILGTAQTGTGKTIAFAIPLITHLIKNPKNKALILTPTRELAAQVLQSIRELLDRTNPIATALLIGGDPMPKQLQQLKRNARIVVGTPGRTMDHLQRKTLKLDTTTFLVLDETDRMLDMGFSEDINKILSKLPKHQTLLFSATIPKNIMSLAEKFLHQPARIAVGGDNKPIENVKQETLQVTEASKYDQLVLELEKRTGSIIVFVKTKRGAERLAKKLRGEDYSVDAIHGDLRQSKRDRVILNYRKLKFRILVATDVAARGLDIPHIEHVINYDITQSPEDYVHRIGRTARAGAKGFALTFLTNADRGKWDAIQKLINPSYKSQSGGSSRPGSSKSYKGKPRKGSRGGSKFGSPKASGGQGSKQFTFKSKTKKTFSKTKKTFVKKPA